MACEHLVRIQKDVYKARETPFVGTLRLSVGHCTVQKWHWHLGIFLQIGSRRRGGESL
jgi:hypothetical protein